MHPAVAGAVQRCALHPGTCVLRHVTRTSRAIVAAFDRALAPVRLTGQQFNVLMSLSIGGPMKVAALARHVGIDATTVPRLLAPLARAGLVASHAGRDRRERIVSITPKGARRVAAALPRWDAEQRRLVAAVTRSGWRRLCRELQQLRSGTDGARKYAAARSRRRTSRV
jgi:DNA-binding MarR family transcriptional regulator